MWDCGNILGIFYFIFYLIIYFINKNFKIHLCSVCDLINLKNTKNIYINLKFNCSWYINFKIKPNLKQTVIGLVWSSFLFKKPN
jgi:hypothetical protein